MNNSLPNSNISIITFYLLASIGVPCYNSSLIFVYNSKPKFKRSYAIFSLSVLLFGQNNSVTLFHVGLFIAALLISVAVWQMRYYKNVLSTIRLRNLKRRDFLFYSRQAGRRFQMHGLLGLAGLGMAVGFYIPHTRPLLWTVLWIFVIIFLY